MQDRGESVPVPAVPPAGFQLGKHLNDIALLEAQ